MPVCLCVSDDIHRGEKKRPERRIQKYHLLFLKLLLNFLSFLFQNFLDEYVLLSNNKEIFPVNIIPKDYKSDFIFLGLQGEE